MTPRGPRPLRSAKSKGGAASPHPDQPLLFELPPPGAIEPLVRPLRHPIWTEYKARLIERYLYYFVLITKHGTYIDGFAGPQEPGRDEMWAASLVLNSEPRWLGNFFLFDRDPEAVQQLKDLRTRQPAKPKRHIGVHSGDFNEEIPRILRAGEIKRKEATFCLLDQRTFECKWSTLNVLAEYKTPKIELFYFLGNLWLDRALAAARDGTIAEWWGRDDWERLKPMKQPERMLLLATRFRQELGYASVKGWPIMERRDGGHVMYYMIHATDHAHAPLLMQRAYQRVLQRREPPEQVRLELGQ